MNKVKGGLLLGLVSFALAGCGSEESNATSESTAAIEGDFYLFTPHNQMRMLKN